jgi:hypothetical protein
MVRYTLTAVLLFGVVDFGRAEDHSPEVFETFYQELDVRRAPQFVVQGVSVAQQIHYQVRSSFEVYEPDPKGNFKAVQTVENTTLVNADALSMAVFTQSLAELKGRKFTFNLDRNRDVISVQGDLNNTEIVEVKTPNSIGTLVSTLIDDDGWKELAQLTLFAPLDPRRPNAPFVRKTEHDWGSLGNWYGKTTFTHAGAQRGMSNYRFQHQLEYIKPIGPGNLPFEIQDAQFQAYEAGGIIQFDTKAKRVLTVRERFRAKGTVQTTMLGSATSVSIDEQQEFSINVSGYQRKTARSESKAATPAQE